MKAERVGKHVADIYGLQRFRDFSISLGETIGAPDKANPEDLFIKVLQGTGLDVGDFVTHLPLFGLHVWLLKPEADKDDLFNKHREKTFQRRIIKLLNNGLIREGYW